MAKLDGRPTGLWMVGLLKQPDKQEETRRKALAFAADAVYGRRILLWCLVWRAERCECSKASGWTAGIDRLCPAVLPQIVFEKCR